MSTPNSTEQLRREVTALRQKLESLEKVRRGRLETEAALKESLELYQTLIETSPFAVFFTDLQGKIILVNPDAVAMCGAGGMPELIGE
ncbi:MAG: PAS domain S-box protein, partial [Candidatus Omnitrophica bacterium]|nr:PAS domain S-box protein [Candidatus Omnitrophota bacterium]